MAKTYAMVLIAEVIDVLKNQETKPYWPPNSVGTPIDAIECSDEVEVGWEYNRETGAFINPTIPEPVEPPEPQPTQLDEIQEAVNKSNEELRQEGATAYALELNKAYTEGVNSL